MGQSGVAVSHTGNTVETALASVPIPPNILGLAGKLRISATFSVSSTSYIKTARIRYGNGLAGDIFYDGAVNAPATLIHALCEVSMSGAANAEVTAHGQTETGPGISADSLTTGNINTSVAQTVVLSGALANSSDTITLQQYTVELLRP